MKVYRNGKKLLLIGLLIGSQYTYADAPVETKSTPLPLFSPFDWSQAGHDGGGYIEKGTVCNSLPTGGQVCNASTLVIDPPNKRYFLDLGALGGQYYIFEDSAWIANVDGSTACFQVSGWNWEAQVNGYKTVVSQPGATDERGLYSGLALDIGGCVQNLGITFKLQHNVVSQWSYAQYFPIPGLCWDAQGVINFNREHDRQNFKPRLLFRFARKLH